MNRSASTSNLVKTATQDLTRSGLVTLRNVFLPGTWGGRRLISCFHTPAPLQTPATMGKQKGGYYAVRTGRVPGIYSSWAAAEAQVKGGRYSSRLRMFYYRLTTAQASPERNTKSLVRKKKPDRIWVLCNMLPDPRTMLSKYPPPPRIPSQLSMSGKR